MDIKRLTKTATIPTRATDGSAGLDLYADISEEKTIAVGEIFKVPTSIAIALPCDTVGLVTGRSGMGINHGVTLVNSVGVIDSDYRGEIQVGLINRGKAPYTVSPNDRIAQLLVVPVLMETPVEVSELLQTARGTGGFGHSGKK